jgi:hypothetical protein
MSATGRSGALRLASAAKLSIANHVHHKRLDKLLTPRGGISSGAVPSSSKVLIETKQSQSRTRYPSVALRTLPMREVARATVSKNGGLFCSLLRIMAVLAPLIEAGRGSRKLGTYSDPGIELSGHPFATGNQPL